MSDRDDTADRQFAKRVLEELFAHMGFSDLRYMSSNHPYDLESPPGPDQKCVEVRRTSNSRVYWLDKEKLSRLKDLLRNGKQVFVFIKTAPPDNKFWPPVAINDFPSSGKYELPPRGIRYLEVNYDLPTESGVEHYISREFRCAYCKSNVKSERYQLECVNCSHRESLFYEDLATDSLTCTICGRETRLSELKDKEFRNFRGGKLACVEGHPMTKTVGDYLNALHIKKLMDAWRVRFTTKIGKYGFKKESQMYCRIDWQEVIRNFIDSSKAELHEIVQRGPELFPEYVGPKFEKTWSKAVEFLPGSTDQPEYLLKIIRRRAEQEIADINRRYKKKGAKEKALRLLREKDAWGAVDKLLGQPETNEAARALEDKRRPS